MFENIRANLLRRVPMPEEHLDIFCKSIEIRNVKRKRAVLSEGNIPDFVIYVNKGLIRMFTTDDNLDERTIEFAPEDTWMADLKAFRNKWRSGVNIDAIEDSELFMIHYDAVRILHDRIPTLERFSRFHAEEKYINTLDRLLKINRADFSAEERYLTFLESQPELANRIPSVFLASYLGIVPETLSRIRKNLTR